MICAYLHFAVNDYTSIDIITLAVTVWVFDFGEFFFFYVLS